MWILSLVPFVLQVIVILFDEGYFHLRRGLPKWERIGHPLDTLTVILCMGYVLFVPFSFQNLLIYAALATFSTVFVTKDEFVHKEHCPAAEIWLHALLFTLHPITLISAGFIWPVVQGAEVATWITSWLSAKEPLLLFLRMQMALMTLFMLYQIIYWNWVWKEE